jgi:hypothetical protein
MALSEQYFLQSGLETVFRDKDTGLPLANGTLEFYRDIQRNIAKPVYRLSGTQPNYTYSSLGAVITLNAAGEIQDNSGNNIVIYYKPYHTNDNGSEVLDLYYVVCKNADGVEQWTREAWPNILPTTDPTQETPSYDNQISNPTFTNVFINEGISTEYTVSSETNKVFSFAPNWEFVISGSGTVTVSRVALRGIDLVPTSPPYAIDVLVGPGITSCLLRQRYLPNSGLWGSTEGRPIFLNGSFVVKNVSPGTQNLEMLYADSEGGRPIEIISEGFGQTFALIQGSTENALRESANTKSGDLAWVDIYLSFFQNSHVQVTQVQVSPSVGEAINFIPSDANSSNREQAYQGDYYIPELVRKPVESLLVGWDFPLNPRQFSNTDVKATLTGEDAYLIDQTIAQKATTGGLTVTRSDDSITNGMRFSKVGAGGSFYIAQYLEPSVAKKMMTDRFSVNVYGYRDNSGTDVTMRVYLLAGTTENNFPLLSSSALGTINPDGTFVPTATGWVEIYRSGLPTAQANLNTVSTNDKINSKDNDYGFTGWKFPQPEPPTSPQTIKNAAIVVTFTSSGASDFVINSISLTPGDLPSRPPVKTKNQVKQECQRYYEASLTEGTDYTAGPLTAPQRDQKHALPNSPTNQYIYESFISTFMVKYNVEKRALVANLVFRSPKTAAGTIGNIQFIAKLDTSIVNDTDRVISNEFDVVTLSKNSFTLTPKNSNTRPYLGGSSGAGAEQKCPVSYIKYHYIADPRLGIIP